jgi:2-polyprenyl-6-hydroxyphenyl methylase / 3-demethylubiquinone-9 3-methyltransferase
VNSLPADAVERSRAAYNEWHARHEVNAKADAPWYQLVKRFLRLDIDVSDRQVLDIGCGLGGFSVWLATRSAPPTSVTGADFSPVAVEKACAFGAAQGVDRIEWRTADIQDLREFEQRFDTVFSFETIEHVPDPCRAVSELARALRPGGRLYLTTPNYMSTIGLYRAYCRVRGRVFDEGGQPICHVTTSPKTRRWVKQAGLRVLNVAGVGHYLPFPGRPPFRFHVLDRLGPLTKWFAHHTMVVAEKPQP